MVKTWGKPVIAQTSSGDLNRITSVLRPAGVTVERQKSGRRLIFGYPVHSKGGALKGVAMRAGREWRDTCTHP